MISDQTPKTRKIRERERDRERERHLMLNLGTTEGIYA